MTRRSRLSIIAVSLGLALAQFRLIAFVFGEQYSQCVAAAHGVVEGRPHWRIYQNRVLGPYVIDALAHVFPSWLSAHVAYTIIALAVAGVLAYRVGARLGGKRAGVAALLTFHLAFALLLSRPWLYAWDLGDAIVFLVFVDFVLAGRKWPAFAALALIGVLNHEIASFVAGWIILDALVRWWRARAEGVRIAWQPIVAGLGTFVASLALVEGVRSALLVEPIGPKIFRDAPAEIGSSFYFTLGKNVEILGNMLTHFDYALPLIVPCFVIAALATAVWLGAREPIRFGALAIVFVGVIASLLVFGILVETRIYIVVIPLVVLGVAYALRDDAGATSAAGTAEA